MLHISNGMNKKIILLIIIIVALGVWFFFPGISNTPQTNEPNETETTEIIGGSDIITSNTKEFVVIGTEFQFSLDEIRVNEGDTVRIVFKNGGGFHDWTIDEFNAGTAQINTGEEMTIEFVADQAGSFEYYCSVGNHRALGMVGTLIVE